MWTMRHRGGFSSLGPLQSFIHLLLSDYLLEKPTALDGDSYPDPTVKSPE